MISSIWFEWDSPHVWYHVLIWYSPHAYATVLMVYMAFSSCLKSFLHILFSIWFALHSPHAIRRFSICCSPHGSQVILLMLDIISPYAVLHMVCVAFSSCFPSCLYMLFSTWFSGHSPHAWHHFSICCSPYGLHCILLMLYIMSPYAVLHMVRTHASLCLKPYITNNNKPWGHILKKHKDKSLCPHGLWHMVIYPPPYTLQALLLKVCPYAQKCRDKPPISKHKGDVKKPWGHMVAKP